MNSADFYKFAAEDGKFRAGEAVYADESAVPVVASLDSDGESSHVVFETTPDAVTGSAAERYAHSWCVWVDLDILKHLLDLAETQA